MDEKGHLLRKCKIALECQSQAQLFEVFLLNHEIQTFPSASLSVILSSAAYILKMFPDLPHPKNSNLKPPNNRIDKEYPSCYLSLNPFFDEWIQLMTLTFFDGNAVRIDDTLHLKIIVSKQFGAGLKKKSIAHKTFPTTQSVSSIFEIKCKENFKKIAWINCSTSQLNRQAFHPNINTVSILLGQIYNNEKYHLYNILKGEIPTVEQLLTYDTLIIPGSGLSVLSKVQAISQLSKNIEMAYKGSDKLKILGICYGHQLLAKIFGAIVVKRTRYGGIQTVNFNTQVTKKFDFLEPLLKYKTAQLTLSEHHEDYVTTTPESFIQLATSNSCQNQAFVSKNGRIFSSQFHPEYIYPFTKAYVGRLRSFYHDQIQQKLVYSHSPKLIEQHIKNSEDLRQCFSKFI